MGISLLKTGTNAMEHLQKNINGLPDRLAEADPVVIVGNGPVGVKAAQNLLKSGCENIVVFVQVC